MTAKTEDSEDAMGGVSEITIVDGHTVKAVAKADGTLSIRIERPPGTGRPLYETIGPLCEDEAQALFQCLLDTVG